MSFSFGFLVAACRIRSATWDMRTRPCVRCMPWPRGFPLVPALPSIGSAGTAVPLFADFTGAMAGSDCFNPFVIDSDHLLSSAAPARLPGRIEALPSPGVGCTCVPGFLRHRGALRTLAMTVPQMLPSVAARTSALRTVTFSDAQSSRPHAPLPTLRVHPRGCTRTACGESGG